MPTAPAYGAPGSGLAFGSSPAVAADSGVVGEVEARQRYDRVVAWIDRQMSNIGASAFMREGQSFVRDIQTLQGATLYQECGPLITQGLGLLRQLADAAISLPDAALVDGAGYSDGMENADFI